VSIMSLGTSAKGTIEIEYSDPIVGSCKFTKRDYTRDTIYIERINRMDLAR